MQVYFYALWSGVGLGLLILLILSYWRNRALCNYINMRTSNKKLKIDLLTGLYNRVDAAMYQAKSEGRNRVVVSARHDN
jgi:hypothetical protein